MSINIITNIRWFFIRLFITEQEREYLEYSIIDSMDSLEKNKVAGIVDINKEHDDAINFYNDMSLLLHTWYKKKDG